MRFHSPDPRTSRRIFFLFLFVVAVIGWLYLFLAGEALSIHRVEASGLKTLDPVDVSREVFDALDHQPHPFWRPARQAWFVDRERLAKALKSRLFAENVTVDKSYGSVLRLKIEERARGVILHSHQQYFSMNLQGLIVNEVPPSERTIIQARLLGQRLMDPDDAPIIHRNLDDVLVPGTRIAAPQDVQGWMDITSQIKKQGVMYREMEPPEESSSTRLIITSSDGFPVWVDTHDGLEAQLNAYKVFFAQKPRGLVVKEYVDLRVPGKVFVK